jgi:hypothetical protein
MLFLACVNYEHNRDTSSASDCMPALLIVDHAITVRYQIRIVEDPSRRLERNSVLPAVGAILPVVPHQDHVYIQNCSTSSLAGLDKAISIEPFLSFVRVADTPKGPCASQNAAQTAEPALEGRGLQRQGLAAKESSRCDNNGMANEEKQKRERDVFLGFINAAHLPIDRQSVKSREPEHSDIECATQGGATRFFEAGRNSVAR